MICRYVRYYIDIQAGEMQGLPPVKSAANIIKEIIHANRDRLGAALICSGYDPYEGYQIY